MSLSCHFACSGCIIESIERADESTLRKLLSEENVEFTDTFWASRESLTLSLSLSLNYSECFPALSTRAAARNSDNRCAHSMREQRLQSGRPSHIAMSIVLTAMLHTTIEFNALQILVESRRFYFREPLVFHWFNSASYFRGENWNVFCVDAAAMAMLLSRGTSLEDPSSFLLLNTLHRNYILTYNMEL